jgi:hypothetical protein
MTEKRDRNLVHRHGWPGWPSLAQFNWGLLLALLLGLLVWVGIVWMVLRLL